MFWEIVYRFQDSISIFLIYVVILTLIHFYNRSREAEEEGGAEKGGPLLVGPFGPPGNDATITPPKVVVSKPPKPIRPVRDLDAVFEPWFIAKYGKSYSELYKPKEVEKVEEPKKVEKVEEPKKENLRRRIKKLVSGGWVIFYLFLPLWLPILLEYGLIPKNEGVGNFLVFVWVIFFIRWMYIHRWPCYPILSKPRRRRRW